MTQALPYRKLWTLSADRSKLTFEDEVIYYGAPPDPEKSSLTRIRGRGDYVSTTDRSLLVPGTYRPDATTAGYIAGTTFTEITGATKTYSANNPINSPAVVSDTMFTTRVNHTGQYMDFHNCWFRGSPTENNACVTQSNANVRRIRYYDCTFEHNAPRWGTNGIYGWQYELYRCEFKTVVDAFSHVSSAGYANIDQGIVVKGCWVHDQLLFSPCPDAAGGITDNANHTDGAQIRGGYGFHYQGNSLEGKLDPTQGQAGVLPINLPSGSHVTGNKYATPSDPSLETTSCFMFSPDLGLVDGLLIEDNWLDGAAVTINMAARTTTGSGGQPGKQGGGIVIRNNRFGRYHRASPAPGLIIAQTSLPMTVTGNHYFYDATGTPYTGPESTWPAANIRTAG